MPQNLDKKKILMASLLSLVGLVLVAGAVYKIGFGHKAEYQAVFLNNDQVYFGRLYWGWGKAKLRDVHYMRITSVLQPQTGEAQPDVQVVKLGGELHGPEAMMYLNKDTIMFWENLRSDSAVVQSIKKLKEAGTTTNK